MWSFEIEGEYYSVVLYLAKRKYEMAICAFVYLIIIIMMTIIIIMIIIITNFILISRKKLEHTLYMLVCIIGNGDSTNRRKRKEAIAHWYGY